MSVSVKVMRSYDYCHFEVCLGSDDAKTDEEIDALRKRAARLVDKAVEQYKVAKAADSSVLYRREKVNELRAEADRIGQLSDKDRTPRQQARLKALRDFDFQRYIDERYDYQDDWDDRDPLDESEDS